MVGVRAKFGIRCLRALWPRVGTRPEHAVPNRETWTAVRIRSGDAPRRAQTPSLKTRAFHAGAHRTHRATGLSQVNFDQRGRSRHRASSLLHAAGGPANPEPGGSRCDLLSRSPSMASCLAAELYQMRRRIAIMFLPHSAQSRGHASRDPYSWNGAKPAFSAPPRGRVRGSHERSVTGRSWARHRPGPDTNLDSAVRPWVSGRWRARAVPQRPPGARISANSGGPPFVADPRPQLPGRPNALWSPQSPARLGTRTPSPGLPPGRHCRPPGRDGVAPRAPEHRRLHPFRPPPCGFERRGPALRSPILRNTHRGVAIVMMCFITVFRTRWVIGIMNTVSIHVLPQPSGEHR